MFEGFTTSISRQRLEAYRSTNSDDLEVFTRCLWNTAICESFYPTLQFLEVGLRNAMHNALTFCNKTPHWYKSTFMCNMCKEDVVKAEEKLTEDGKNPNDAGQMVSEFSFGFWVRLFNKHYQIPLWNNKTFLIRTFPNATNIQRARHTLSVRIDDIRKFRNRVFHHERILGYDLAKYHREMIEMLGWISTDLVVANSVIDRFANVNSAKFAELLKKDASPHFI